MKEVKIHVIRNGKVLIDRALAYKEQTIHPMPYTGWFRGKKKKMWVPVSSYLIEHPKGLVLVDTGWHTDIRDKQRRHLSYLVSTMFKGKLPEGEAIHEQLHKRGFSPSDLDYVVLSHMHTDHVSGLKHVKDAKQLIVSEKEWNAANKDFGYVKSMWEGVKVDLFSMGKIPFGPFHKGLDLFQDESLYLVYTPGHSKGHVSVLVKVAGGWVLLAADAGYSPLSWNEQILPGVVTDENDMKKSLQWVKAFSERSDCVEVIANHDPEGKERIIQ
ncbi:MAG TPA: N-acyl homoserine lactonase family protein [Bacillales bacterium]|nr:N-acyl homoserine lactonase family protein [Bacillales bacterium]